MVIGGNSQTYNMVDCRYINWDGLRTGTMEAVYDLWSVRWLILQT